MDNHVKSSIAFGLMALFLVAAVSLARVAAVPESAADETIRRFPPQERSLKTHDSLAMSLIRSLARRVCSSERRAFTLIAPVKPMLLAASNVHYRNNLILGKSETPETFAVETNTNYSSSDYNGFRPNDGAEFSFEWSTPPFAMRANLPGEPGKLSTQQQTVLEAKAREVRRFKTLREYSAATGQDKHSVLVDYDTFVKVTPAGPDPRTLYRPADFDFHLRPDSPAIDAGVRLLGVNDDFTGRAPDLGAYEAGRPVPHYGPRE